MTTKNLVGLAVAAVVLGGAAYWCGVGKKMKAPSLNGKPVVAAFDMADIARVDIGSKVSLVAADDGWKIETLFGYPADAAKIRENILKLSELKVGQVAGGVKIASPVKVALKDAKGKVLAEMSMGDVHRAKPKGEMAMYGGGGYPDGRYLLFGDRTVLVKDTLDCFDGDPMKWVNAQLCETPYVRFNSVVDPAKVDECGFATGAVCKVTYKGNSNAVAKVGGTVPGGTDRYFKLDSEKWIFTIPSYTVDSLIPKPKEEPKKPEAAKAEPKKPEPKKAESQKK